MRLKQFPVGYSLIFMLALGNMQLYSLEIREKLPKVGTTIVLRFDSGHEAWTKYVMQRTRDFILAAHTYFDEDLRPKKIPPTILIVGRRDKVTANGIWVKAINNATDIQIEYEVVPIGNASLLFHELGHYFGLGEGTASFLPLALYYSGHMQLSPQEVYQIGTWWQIRNPQIIGDIPIAQLNRDMSNLDSFDFTLAYGKTFKMNYIVYKQLGAGNFQKFVNTALRESNKIGDQDFPVSILKRDFSADWQTLLSGWYYPGGYQTHKPSEFTDTDYDGLTDFEEVILGTDSRNPDTDGDGISDGYEFLAGLNPLVKDDWRGKNIMLPVADGLKEDWNNLSGARIHEGKINNNTPGNQNILRLRYFLSRNNLFILLETRESPVFHQKGTMADILVDVDGNSRHGDAIDMDIALSTDVPDNNWIWQYRKSRAIPGLKTGGIDAYEFQIPLKVLKGKSIRVLPILRDGNQAKNLSEWHEWLEIKIR